MKTPHQMYISALALALGGELPTSNSSPAHGIELIARWSTEELKKEYDLIQIKESSMSRRERDYVVQEYGRRMRA